MSKLQMPDVSLFAVTSRDHLITPPILRHCQSLIDFGNTVYGSDHKPAIDCRVNMTYLETPHFDYYHEPCIWYMTSIGELKPYFKNFILSIHHDGYIVRPEAWTDEFYEYDFIGSPWLWGGVGNNAFCMYTQKFIDCIVSLKLPPTKEACHPCDMVIFNQHEEWKKKFGIKIAPIELAKKFGAEGFRYDGCFGFHGLYNIPCMKQYSGISLPEHHKYLLDAADFHRYTPLK